MLLIHENETNMFVCLGTNLRSVKRSLKQLSQTVSYQWVWYVHVLCKQRLYSVNKRVRKIAALLTF